MNQLKRSLAVSVACACAAFAAPSAWAVGFGRVAPQAVLGQPLDLSIPVNVEEGERFGEDCARVQVWFGENQLNPGTVHSEVTRGGDGQWRVRVSTTLPVNEPVVEISVAAGCNRPFTRRFTAFADPPFRMARATAGSSTAAAGAGAGSASASSTPNPAGETQLVAAAPAATSAGPGKAHAGPTRAAAAERAARRSGHAGAGAAVAAPRSVVARAGARKDPLAKAEGPGRLVLEGGYARLRLDMEDPVMPPAGAASAAGTTLADLEDPDLKRLHTLEDNLAAIKRESQASRAQTDALNLRLAQAESRADWLPWLMAALGLTLIGAGVLGWQLKRAMRPRSAKPWFQESAMPPGAPAAPGLSAASASVRAAAPAVVATSESADLSIDAPRPGVPPSLALDQVVPTDAAGAPMAYVEDLSATQPLSRAALAAALAAPDAAAPPRELSVEELLDLEQQADFFIALGQEDAAIDLLMSHLRSAGGQSPLPYTKLLEIYRRQGDRAAYERMRARFNRRFNAYAPDWDVGPAAGRHLEDYPETVERVQAVWASPLDAMAILEALLFKRDDTSELFDLPAYHDILLLYSLARDLWQQSGESTGTLVDVLLPLEDFDPDAPLLPEEQPADPWSSHVEDGLPPSKAPASAAPAYELTGFEMLADKHEGGVQATLDAAHLPPQPGSGPRADASNDEAAPAPEPGSSRGPSLQR